jgi:hypothetical protein
MTGMAIFKIGGWVGLMLSESPAGSQTTVAHERVTRAKARPQINRARFQDGKASGARPQRVRAAGSA